jgi:uncharacterized protein involved in exopolysaccharide biosynthesis
MEPPVLHPAGAIAHFNRELARLAQERAERARRTAARHARLTSASERLAHLEEDLARAAVLLRTLINAALARGVMTREELMLAIARVDLRDGRTDGLLDPGEYRALDEPQSELTTAEMLRKLESEA